MRRQLGLGLLLALALTACAEPGSTVPPAEPGGPASSSPTPAAGPTSLTIVVDASGTMTWDLTCAPPDGTHPDPGAACAALEQNGERALPPVDEDRLCTEVYGGDQTATVTGTWRGERVDSRFSLKNGCEISRWTSLVGLLPPADA